MFKLFTRVAIILVTLIVSVLFFLGYGKKSEILYGDALGYYTYLPAFFIYDDFTTIKEVPDRPDIPSFVAHNITYIGVPPLRTPKGFVVIQYTYGIALMEAPFFLAAHLYEKITGRSCNGYSEIYQGFLKFGHILYAFWGLLISYRLLKRYFNPLHSLITIACIFVGTNLFWFTLCQSGMAHVPLFFLYAALVCLTVRLHEKASWLNFILTGLVLGLIILIRPSDIIAVLIPLMYKVRDKKSLWSKLQFIKSHLLKVVPVIVLIIVLWIPQLIYWKYISGSYFFDSYGPTQKFHWLHPMIINGLFYGSNGWFFYSPVMIFSMLGLFYYQKIKNWSGSLYTLLPLYIYIVYSWYCFSYINGLGSRPMIHLYPLLAIPFAAFVYYISKKGVAWKYSFALLCMFFIAMNISFSVQKAKGLVNSEESNMAYTIQTLFRYNINYNDLVVRDVAAFQPDTAKLIRIGILAFQGFEDSLSDNNVKDTDHGSAYVYRIKSDEEYPGQGIVMDYNKDLFKDAQWIKCSGRFMNPEAPGYYNHLLVIEARKGNDFLLWKSCKIENKIDLPTDKPFDLNHFTSKKWGKVSFFIKVPKGIKKGYRVNLNVWNIGFQELYMDDLCIELYK